MRINKLRGTVADRPIDVQVIQESGGSNQSLDKGQAKSLFEKIQSFLSDSNFGESDIWLNDIPSYGKG
jgi:hypothetical protein